MTWISFPGNPLSGKIPDPGLAARPGNTAAATCRPFNKHGIALPGQPLMNPRGFTILELLVVMSVIAVIAALVLPGFSSILDRMEQKSSIKEITTALRFARSKAVSGKIPIVFQAEFEKNRYWLEEPQTGKVSEVRNLSKGIVFREFFDGEDVTTDGLISIVYFPRGNTSGGSLRLSAPKQDDEREWFEIEIDQVTGKPKITNNPYAPEEDNV